MRITYSVNEKMNHNEIRLVVHPNNEKLVHILVSQFDDALGEIEVYDELKNKYPIPLLSVYYFELIDDHIYVYTKDKVFCTKGTSLSALKQKIKSFGFYRINVRTIVNMKYVLTYSKMEGCRRRVELDNGEVLISNRRFYKEVDRMMLERSMIFMK